MSPKWRERVSSVFAREVMARWHASLHLSQQPRHWYRDRLREELCERRTAQSAWQELSETADVFYIISRAKWDGFPLRNLPRFKTKHIFVYGYLFAKYSLRWQFYRVAARRCNCPSPTTVREVVNPAKDYKLCEVAERHGIDPIEFVRGMGAQKQVIRMCAGRGVGGEHWWASRTIQSSSPSTAKEVFVTASLKYKGFSKPTSVTPSRRYQPLSVLSTALPRLSSTPAKDYRHFMFMMSAPAQLCITDRCQGDQLLNLGTCLASADQDEGSKQLVIGLYGIPGCGKSFVLSYLKQELEGEDFELFEGAEKIAALVPGGLDAFHTLKEQDKARWRGRAIREIGKESKRSGRSAVVTGHYMFWPEGDDVGQLVYTNDDLATFTHILYLAEDPERIAQRRSDDSLRKRPWHTAGHLRKWQEAEVEGLRRLCHEHGIIFALLQSQTAIQHRVSSLARLFRQDRIGDSLSRVPKRLDEVLPDRHLLQTVLVLDADKTLAAEDAGALFWEACGASRPSATVKNPLGELFGGPLSYTESAFRQATLLYEEAATDEEYEALCEIVASRIKIHDEFRSFLRATTKLDCIGAVVITCGLRRVWEKVLTKEGLSSTVKVIGGGRTSDGFVITAATKAAIVCRLRNVDHLRVIAFGDSPLDLPMLEAANEAIIVVGEERTRSHSMDAALAKAIDENGLRARQILLPGHASARLDNQKLPQMRLDDKNFVEQILDRHSDALKFRILHATDKEAAKLLMTPTRDASVAGPVLRAAHKRMGRYLGVEYLSVILGLEEHLILHVQGHHTKGYRLQHERQTTIVALMRGGEPMAMGLNDIFPQAAFLHATSPLDIKQEHLQHQRAVVLVDSVINTGKTLIRFIEHTRRTHSSIRIVIVAGVVQNEVVSDRHPLATLMRRCNISLIALRVSGNKFTGKGTTDTGNRLFQWYG